MDPIRFAIDNPVKVSVGVVLVILFGLLALRAIPIQLTPSVDRPVISVSTQWEGASPAEIESEVVREQEDQLKSIQGLEKMTSTSQFGQGQVVLEFPVGTDKKRALIDVSEKLRQVPDYPEDVDEPEVEPTDPQDRDYIAWIILTSEDKTYDVRHLQKWAQDNVQTALERVAGVSEVNVLGGSEPEVQIQFDPVKLAQHSIPPEQMVESIRALNVNVSAGDIEEGKLNVRTRATGEYEALYEVGQTIISAPDEPVVRVADVGEVVLTYKEPSALVRSRGELALAINVQQEVGSNIMQVMAGLKAAIRDLNDNILPRKAEQLGLAGRLTLDQVYDQTVYVEQAIALVRNNIFFGGALALTVLLLFLRSIRATTIVALAIPVSIIGTFVAIVGMGRNINVISLAGLAFAVGMVVDNAIVVLENIDRQLGLGKTPRDAAHDGGREVWGAILASTLTTLAVFIPVIFIQEEAGQLFRDISLAICAAVTLSLITSVMVIPSAAARFLRHRGEAQRAGGISIAGGAGRFTGKFRDGIYWLTQTLGLRWAIVIVLAGASIVLSYVLMPPATYLPSGNRNLAFGLLIPPPGYNLKKMEQIGQRFEAIVGPYWQAKLGEPSAQQLDPIVLPDRGIEVPGVPLTNFFFVGQRTGLMFSGGISADDTRVKPIAALLNKAIGQQPGMFGFAQQRALISRGGAGNSIELEISGDDYDAVTASAGALFGRLVQRFPQIRPDPGNFAVPSEEVNVVIDLVRASELGLNNRAVGQYVQMLGDGAIVGDYSYRGDKIDLKVLTRGGVGDAEALADQPMMTPTGRVVPLGAVAQVRRTPAPQQIRRIERRRAVTLEIAVPQDVPLETAEAMIQNDFITPLREQKVIPPTIFTRAAGTAAQLSEVKRAMLGRWTGFNLDSVVSLVTSRGFLALFVVFLLMAALFESWFYPTVIMFTVPLATIGGFLGLRIVHEWTDRMIYVDAQQLDVLTMLGFVILIGIVVNNAILIVHQALNFMRGQGDIEGVEGRQKLDPKRAIAESVRTRIRPILMSMCTSVGGMLPLVVIPGAGSELYRGLGSVVVGGLLVSTVFTLVLTPLVMSLVFDFRKRVGSARV